MLIYHAYMDTDIDKWDTLSFNRPEKNEDDWYWDFYCVEINSLYEFIQEFENLQEFDNIEEFLFELIKKLDPD